MILIAPSFVKFSNRGAHRKAIKGLTVQGIAIVLNGGHPDKNNRNRGSLRGPLKKKFEDNRGDNRKHFSTLKCSPGGFHQIY